MVLHQYVQSSIGIHYQMVLKNLTQSEAKLSTLCGTSLVLKTAKVAPMKQVVIYRRVPNDVMSCNLQRYDTNGDTTVDITPRSPSDGVISVVNSRSNDEYTTFKIVNVVAGGQY